MWIWTHCNYCSENGDDGSNYNVICIVTAEEIHVIWTDYSGILYKECKLSRAHSGYPLIQATFYTKKANINLY